MKENLRTGICMGLALFINNDKAIKGVWNMGKLAVDRSHSSEEEDEKSPERPKGAMMEERKVQGKGEEEKIEDPDEKEMSVEEEEFESEEENLSDQEQQHDEDVGRMEIAA